VIDDRADRDALPSGFVDDASALNATRAAEVVAVPKDLPAAEAQLVALVQRAARDGVAVSIAGARHSMGGHTLRSDGIQLDLLPLHAMRLDEERGVLHVQAGARWFQVIEHLNARGFSVAVMQSNNDFSVGGSVSVNCHGWQCRRAPIASTVRALRILLSDGRILRCTREEHAELFSLALGGYGLFGVILDLELDVVPNEQYQLERFIVPLDQYAALFEREVSRRDDAGMAYGRLSVAPASFLQEAILNVYRRVPGTAGRSSRLNFPESEILTRAIFRGQVGSDYGKALRWQAEKHLQDLVAHGPVDRNQLLSEPAAVFGDRSLGSTDILHEYFVPQAALAGFVESVREIVPRHRGDLLNLTVRDLRADSETFLRYADGDMFALVLLFSQRRTSAGEAEMQAMTRELIDAAAHAAGRYYLPYRLHATGEQLAAAYPQAARFFELKRQFDPRETFQNEFYARYGRLATREVPDLASIAR